jgi:hypothetical protein
VHGRNALKLADLSRTADLCDADRERFEQPDTHQHQPAPIDPSEEWFRHYNWKDKRAKVRAALDQTTISHRSLNNFDNCGSECVVMWNETEKRYRLAGNFCHSRHCDPCVKSKSNLIAANLKKRLESNPSVTYRFVTLTLRHTNQPLAKQIKRLYSCWRTLRNTDMWKHGELLAEKLTKKSRKNAAGSGRPLSRQQILQTFPSRGQVGGAAMFENKYNNTTREHHPHLHIICEGHWLDHRSLQSEWYRITGDSFKADIRMIRERKDVAYYVAKYASKGVNSTIWDDQPAAIEWIRAIASVRTCATFGTWRGMKLLEKPPIDPGWHAVGFLSVIADKARQGSVTDINLLLLLEDALQYNPHRSRSAKPP